MKTFFCRHTSSLDIDKKTFESLWDNDVIAIHYPTSKRGWSEEGDCESLDPNDYIKSAKKALIALIKLSKNGGYVFSQYKNQNNYKVGVVNPGTKIQLIKGRWGNSDREAILKGLKLSNTKVLKPTEAIQLTCAQPRQGTICVWSKIGKRVENVVNNIEKRKKLSDLTPDLQEVLCSEFLRAGIDEKLPMLDSFLTPIGRTMKDVDIIGITSQSKKVLAQVTYNFEPQLKINRLKKYALDSDVCLILFCKTNKSRTVNGVYIYSIEEVFDKFSSSDKGQSWLNSIY